MSPKMCRSQDSRTVPNPEEQEQTDPRSVSEDGRALSLRGETSLEWGPGASGRRADSRARPRAGVTAAPCARRSWECRRAGPRGADGEWGAGAGSRTLPRCPPREARALVPGVERSASGSRSLSPEGFVYLFFPFPHSFSSGV